MLMLFRVIARIARFLGHRADYYRCRLCNVTMYARDPGELLRAVMEHERGTDHVIRKMRSDRGRYR